jgi:hypothetical protein
MDDLRDVPTSRIVLALVGDFCFERCSIVGDFGGARIPNIEDVYFERGSRINGLGGEHSSKVGNLLCVKTMGIDVRDGETI